MTSLMSTWLWQGFLYKRFLSLQIQGAYCVPKMPTLWFSVSNSQLLRLLSSNFVWTVYHIHIMNQKKQNFGLSLTATLAGGHFQLLYRLNRSNYRWDLKATIFGYIKIYLTRGRLRRPMLALSGVGRGPVRGPRELKGLVFCKRLSDFL